MQLVYRNSPLFISRLNYKLGSRRRDLEQLQSENLLAGSIEALRDVGYQFSFGLAQDETLLSLAAAPCSATLAHGCHPAAAVFQHCYAESAVLPWEPPGRDVGVRNRYFGASLLKELGMTELPYFCSFASGCAGFVFLCTAAAGILLSSSDEAVICIMADSMPDGVAYDLARERILGSAQSSTFVVSRSGGGYQLLGAALYSSTRSLIPLLELVKRTVEMIKGLAEALSVNLDGSDVLVHYPNMFPEAWKMVTRYLRLSGEGHVLLGMAERAHCFGSDSAISLAQLYRGRQGRLHFVVNYGLGLHLGVCVLKELSS